MSSVTATINPYKGYSVAQVGQTFITAANPIQSIILTRGMINPKLTISGGIITGAIGTTVKTIPSSSDNYSINSPLLYVVNNSGVVVTVNNRDIPIAATVVFVYKLDSSYGLLDMTTPAVPGAITSVV